MKPVNPRLLSFDQVSGLRHSHDLELVIARFAERCLERTAPANNGTDDSMT
jgi:hypothetical protein